MLAVAVIHGGGATANGGVAVSQHLVGAAVTAGRWDAVAVTGFQDVDADSLTQGSEPGRGMGFLRGLCGRGNGDTS